MTEKQYAEIMGMLAEIRENQISKEGQECLIETLSAMNDVLEQHAKLLSMIKGYSQKARKLTDDPDLLC
tara:strand:+ start:284 stop:490 length:207 start_codon:yes stop_codon:yes gene_type:complete